MKPQVQFASQALTTAALKNMGAVTLTQDVWDVGATSIFQTASGTNAGVTMVSTMKNTSSTRNDDSLAFTRLPTVNFSSSSSIDVSACVPVSRIYTVTGALSCVLPSIMAVCIA